MRYIALVSVWLGSWWLWTGPVLANERAIVAAHCQGRSEEPLADRTRVDCLTERVAWEYDYAPKYHEALGQALHYGARTDRQPGVILIIKSPRERIYLKRLRQTIEHFGLSVALSSIEVDDYIH